MKKFYFLFVLLLAGFNSAYSQQQLFTNQPSDSAVRQDPRSAKMQFVQGEILIKFKDEIVVSKGKNLKSFGIDSVDKVLLKYGISGLDKVFPTEKILKSAMVMKDPQGREMKIPSLHNIYKIMLSQLKATDSLPINIFEVMEKLKALPEVEYAESNYIFTIGDFTPAGPEISMTEAMQPSIQEISQTNTAITPNDPLYSMQWGIPATKINMVWDTTTGDTNSIIAILDTGVDWLHPDLAANIWNNKQEIPGNGIDDDGNGKIDDVRGWDFINNDNNSTDDNSHGTHCAGIAAAVGNNGIGIAGVNWKAKIMPIKVFQSSGQGNSATIAQGVTYAANKGAKVISMSFGSYSESLTLKNALASAYATAVLVAAAGNDGLCIGPGKCPDKQIGMPMYPGAYAFVLGVEANANSYRAGFSNYDQDGAVFSNYPDLLNYELKAPGAGIISCVPGGSYREYSGTSMATPLVAGAVSLYRILRPVESQELLFGNFINSINQNIDLKAALDIVPIPNLDVVSYELKDSIYGDNDGRADAGETIELKVLVRNTWGKADSVKVGIEFGEFEDTTTAVIINNEAFVGSISAYSTRFNIVSLKIKIDSTIADGRDIVFKLKTWYGNHMGENTQQIIINVENGIELGGIISSNLSLYPNKQYIITDNIVIPLGVTLTIKPGTILKFADNKRMIVAGNIYAVGTRDSLITFTKRDNGLGWCGIGTESSSTFQAAYSVFEYANNSPNGDGDFVFKSQFLNINNCYFRYNFGYFTLLPFIQSYNNILSDAIIENSCFYNNNSYFNTISITNYKGYFIKNNIINNNLNSSYASIQIYIYNDKVLLNNNVFSNINNFFNKEYNIYDNANEFSVVILDSLYYGTTNENKINDAIIDFQEKGYGTWLDISKKMNRPSSEAHGIVWKVVVNGKDAQDEFDVLDPLGVGKQKFEVYFNRAMDTLFDPQVSMGVRYPYNQTSISVGGSWSADSSIYTVYGNIGLSTGDGINTIRVTGAKDTDHFEIPIEDRRFRVIVNGAGSLSEGFAATPGMGKIMLQWENPAEGVNDLLGYNMYRYTFLNDSVTSDTLLINTILLTDTVYTDFGVIPATKYFYAYKTVRTNLTESDFSKIVTTIPLTAAKGDANGDLSVNVLDVTTIISYLLNQHPQPFIFNAADANSDTSVNVLDLIGVVNLIIGNKSTISTTIGTNAIPAYIYLKPDRIQFRSDAQVAGLQFNLKGNNLKDVKLSSLVKGFEFIYTATDTSINGIMFSFSGKTIPAGMQDILKIDAVNAILNWENVTGGDKNGQYVKIIKENEIQNLLIDYDLKAFPNPSSGDLTISFNLQEESKVNICIYNLFGQLVTTIKDARLPKGNHQIHWLANKAGVYICHIQAIEVGNQKNNFTKEIKLIVIK